MVMKASEDTNTVDLANWPTKLARVVIWQVGYAIILHESSRTWAKRLLEFFFATTIYDCCHETIAYIK